MREEEVPEKQDGRKQMGPHLTGTCHVGELTWRTPCHAMGFILKWPKRESSRGPLCVGHVSFSERWGGPVGGLVSPPSTHSFLGPTLERASPEPEGVLSCEVARRGQGSLDPGSTWRACSPHPSGLRPHCSDTVFGTKMVGLRMFLFIYFGNLMTIWLAHYYLVQKQNG